MCTLKRFALLLFAVILISSGFEKQNISNFMNLLSEGKFKTALNDFDDNMRSLLPENKLANVWEHIVREAGKYERIISIKTESVDEFDIYLVFCEFEKQNIEVKLVYNRSGKISGLFFSPADKIPGEDLEYPEYVNRDKFTEVDLSFGDPEYILPATLSIPQGDKKFPLVILVHGSGPNDRDQTIGPNKPFRDISGGLASRGIAVLRYEKRTKEYAEKLFDIADQITIYDEVIEDVLHALGHVKDFESIDEDNIFILGHSLGAMLIPLIAERTDLPAGYIMLATPARPLEDLIYDQFNYIYGQRELRKHRKEFLTGLKKKIDNVKKMKDISTFAPEELPLNIHAKYWLSLKENDPLKKISGMSKPVLIAQGGRDYQVTKKDFDLHRKNLKNRSNFHFKYFRDLNHLFMSGKGKSHPNEYKIPGNVSKDLIDEMTEWVENKGK